MCITPLEQQAYGSSSSRHDRATVSVFLWAGLTLDNLALQPTNLGGARQSLLERLRHKLGVGSPSYFGHDGSHDRRKSPLALRLD